MKLYYFIKYILIKLYKRFIFMGLREFARKGLCERVGWNFLDLTPPLKVIKGDLG